MTFSQEATAMQSSTMLETLLLSTNSSILKLDGMATIFFIEVKDKLMLLNLDLISDQLKLLPKLSSFLDATITSLLRTFPKTLLLFTLDLTEIKEPSMLM